MDGRICLIKGPTSGIGEETAFDSAQNRPPFISHVLLIWTMSVEKILMRIKEKKLLLIFHTIWNGKKGYGRLVNKCESFGNKMFEYEEIIVFKLGMHYEYKMDKIFKLVLMACWGIFFLGTASAETATVLRVIDGDTCLLVDGRRVRYLGINAPEIGEPHARPATFANNTLVAGKTIRLEFLRTRVDRYGRLLAYVFVDDTLVNEALVRQGHAHIRYLVAAKYGERLRHAQEEAWEAGKGIWTNVRGRFITIASVHADATGNDKNNLNDEYIVIENRSQMPIDLTGWTVMDHTSRDPYLFPNFTLPVKGKVTLRTGLGKNTMHELHWGSQSPIWNNKGDSIFVRDADGRLMAVHVYP